MSQDDIFFKGEGDRWFVRNRDALYENARPDAPLTLLELYDLKPKKVLEVGASNGWRLALIAEKYGAKCIGIEPSAKAVADGNKKFKRIRMKRGRASSITLKEQFDLVIVNFVLHWVSRKELLKAIAEIDRCVKDGGHVIVGDFSPDHPSRVPYHHLPDKKVFTYKQDYAAIFTATALYGSVASLTFGHDDHALKSDVPGKDRGIATLLRKSLTDYYIPDERGKS